MRTIRRMKMVEIKVEEEKKKKPIVESIFFRCKIDCHTANDRVLFVWHWWCCVRLLLNLVSSAANAMTRARQTFIIFNLFLGSVFERPRANYIHSFGPIERYKVNTIRTIFAHVLQAS